ncbi:MAG: prolyl-tRNA synthetase associated domain-containing protein [Bacteroidia bacterium]|nr:prolyl-tRNA synthetase associated domain-containing protein [Bacteroidia bacterium]
MSLQPSEKVYNFLAKLEIGYIEFTHPPVYTVEEATEHWGELKGIHCKNLFLRNRRGRQHYLVVLESSKQVDIKKLNEELGERLSFASPERLMKHLSIEPGSVSPFGLINDLEHHVIVVLDSDVADAEMVNFHPNVNTITLGLTKDDFRKYLQATQNHVVEIRF